MTMSGSSKDPPIEAVSAEGPVEGTRLESAEEIRRATRSQRAPTAKEAGGRLDTPGFRPARRPPMAMVCILDDGRELGEWVRIRKDKIVIGRAEGDILIPHDAMLSGRHAEISRQFDKGRYRWYLTDLQSTNGSFVRVSSALLKPGQHVLLGSGCYRFDVVPPADLPGGARGTSAVQGSAPASVAASFLVEMTPQGEGRRLLLTGADNWIGRDPRQCSVVVSGDPLCSPRHARIYREADGRWHLENAGSRNGTWIRVQRLQLPTTSQFQLGEQRFLLRVLR